MLARGVADGEGYFVIGGLVPDDGKVVRAKASGTNVGSEYATPRAGRQSGSPVVIRLYDGRDLQGWIVDEKGDGVAGATVVGWNDGHSFASFCEQQEVETDAKGLFRLRALSAGLVRISIWKDGFVPQAFELPVAQRDGAAFAITRGEGVRLTVRVTGIPADHSEPPAKARGVGGRAAPPALLPRAGTCSRPSACAAGTRRSRS